MREPFKDTWVESQIKSNWDESFIRNAAKKLGEESDKSSIRSSSTRSSQVGSFRNLDMNAWHDGKWHWKLPEDSSRSSTKASRSYSSKSSQDSVGEKSGRIDYEMYKEDKDGQMSRQKAFSIEKSVSKGTEKTTWDKEFWEQPSRSKGFLSNATKSIKAKASRLKAVFE